MAQELRDLIGVTDTTGDDAPTYEEWDERHDVTRTADIGIRLLMWRRRGRDKLNHFMRWAIAATAELPIENRLPNLQAMLPDGLVGRHAMSHLQHVPDLRPAPGAPPPGTPQEGWAARNGPGARSSRPWT